MRQKGFDLEGPRQPGPTPMLPIASAGLPGGGASLALLAVGGLMAFGMYRMRSAEADELDSQVKLQEHIARSSRSGGRMSDDALRQLRRMRAQARVGALLGQAT